MRCDWVESKRAFWAHVHCCNDVEQGAELDTDHQATEIDQRHQRKSSTRRCHKNWPLIEKLSMSDDMKGWTTIDHSLCYLQHPIHHTLYGIRCCSITALLVYRICINLRVSVFLSIEFNSKEKQLARASRTLFLCAHYKVLCFVSCVVCLLWSIVIFHLSVVLCTCRLEILL